MNIYQENAQISVEILFSDHFKPILGPAVNGLLYKFHLDKYILLKLDRTAKQTEIVLLYIPIQTKVKYYKLKSYEKNLNF